MRSESCIFLSLNCWGNVTPCEGLLIGEHIYRILQLYYEEEKYGTLKSLMGPCHYDDFKPVVC